MGETGFLVLSVELVELAVSIAVVITGIVLLRALRGFAARTMCFPVIIAGFFWASSSVVDIYDTAFESTVASVLVDSLQIAGISLIVYALILYCRGVRETSKRD